MLVLGMLVSSIGCSSGARMLRKDARGGELTLWGPVVPSIETAREAMLDHCNGRYRMQHQADAARIVFECTRAPGAAELASSESGPGASQALKLAVAEPAR
jgi:hypothetical protein